MRDEEHCNEIFKTTEIFTKLDKLLCHLKNIEPKEGWVFRAQRECLPLKTTLERCCENWGFEGDAHKIEEMMIREFRRVYEGEDSQDVRKDTLYCLSLLRHYGAPVSLLDFTYSKYVAIYFGLEQAYKSGSKNCPSKIRNTDRSFTLWCINANKLYLRAKNNYQFRVDFIKYLKKRSDISTRDDKSFKPLYMGNKYKVVISESPALIHKRHHLQQSVFLCPGNVKASFMDNLLHLFNNTPKTDEIQKLTCKFNKTEFEDSFKEFKRMNITRESLFPGLGGLAESMEYEAHFYRDLYKRIEQAKLGYKE